MVPVSSLRKKRGPYAALRSNCRRRRRRMLFRTPRRDVDHRPWLIRKRRLRDMISHGFRLHAPGAGPRFV